jgi:hypothetical protein
MTNGPAASTAGVAGRRGLALYFARSTGHKFVSGKSGAAL